MKSLPLRATEPPSCAAHETRKCKTTAARSNAPWPVRGCCQGRNDCHSRPESKRTSAALCPPTKLAQELTNFAHARTSDSRSRHRSCDQRRHSATEPLRLITELGAAIQRLATEKSFCGKVSRSLDTQGRPPSTSVSTSPTRTWNALPPASTQFRASQSFLTLFHQTWKGTGGSSQDRQAMSSARERPAQGVNVTVAMAHNPPV